MGGYKRVAVASSFYVAFLFFIFASFICSGEQRALLKKTATECQVSECANSCELVM